VLENKLHALVCADRLSLASAQHQEGTNWINAYERYVSRKRRSSNLLLGMRTSIAASRDFMSCNSAHRSSSLVKITAQGEAWILADAVDYRRQVRGDVEPDDDRLTAS
jgi:hypothetical protein